MAHNHAHHAGHHHHPVSLASVNRAFIAGIILNFGFIIIEVIVGLSIHSLSLLSDAGHNLADVGSLALSLLAFRLLRVKSNDKYTYGYRKTTVLAALFNAVILLVSIGAIVYEAINHFFHPEPFLPGKTIAIVAGIGIIVNAGSALFFLKEKERDLNVKSAYLHMASDALVSLGLVIGGIVISFTSWNWLDPVLSMVIAVTILVSTWNVLRDSLRLSLDGVPKDIDMEKIRAEAMSIKGVCDIFHIHVWAMSTTENAMTAHLLLKEETNKERESEIKEVLRHKMLHLNIQHLTIETEYGALQTNAANCE